MSFVFHWSLPDSFAAELPPDIKIEFKDCKPIFPTLPSEGLLAAATDAYLTALYNSKHLWRLRMITD
jgi:hypothetical protein